MRLSNSLNFIAGLTLGIIIGKYYDKYSKNMNKKLEESIYLMYVKVIKQNNILESESNLEKELIKPNIIVSNSDIEQHNIQTGVNETDILKPNIIESDIIESNALDSDIIESDKEPEIITKIYNKTLSFR